MSTIAVSVRSSVIWGGFRVWQRNRDAFLRAWKVEFRGILIEPFIMLVAIGFGLGAYIGEIGDMTYAEYLAPGLTYEWTAITFTRPCCLRPSAQRK